MITYLIIIIITDTLKITQITEFSSIADRISKKSRHSFNKKLNIVIFR